MKTKRNPWTEPLEIPQEVIDQLTKFGMVHENIRFTDSNYAPNCFLEKDTVQDILRQLDIMGVLDFSNYKKK